MSINCVCRLLFPFPPEKETCQRWYQEERIRTRQLEPYAGSAWYRAIHQANRDAKTRGELLRATLLSGGSVYCALVTFNALRALKVADIERGVIATDVEWAHNCEGVRVFFELDYRSPETFPSTTEVMVHLSYIQQVVREAYPTLADESHYEMHVATCPPVVTESPDGVTTCKWGVHIVFPHIVTTTQHIRVLAGAVDTRITRNSTQWKDVVDVASYKEANATLRPPFSYKAEKCALCSRRGGKKRAREGGGAGDFPLAPEDLLATDCDCWYGYRIHPSVYTYRTSIRSAAPVPAPAALPAALPAPAACACMSGIQAHSALLDVGAVLQGMSFQPTNGGLFTTEFKTCPDMYELVPTVHKRGPSKENKIHGVNKRRKELQIPAGHQKSCRALVQAAINRAHTWYRALVIETIRYYPCKKYGEFFITVKGPGMRACLHSNKVHRSNRIYFVLRVYSWTLSVGCFDTDCAKQASPNPVATFALQHHEIASLGNIPLPGLHVPIRSISAVPVAVAPPERSGKCGPLNVFQMSAIDRYNECQKRIEQLSSQATGC